jgi:hypothetical protein
MFSLGGISMDMYTHGFLKWLWTISQYLVSTLIITRICESTNKHMSATSVNVEHVFSIGHILLLLPLNSVNSSFDDGWGREQARVHQK